MDQDGASRGTLEERLAAVKRAIEQGLPERARALRAAADRLSEGHGSARADLRRLAHKLRGIMGTFGYERLSKLATELERNAASERAAKVVSMAREIATLAEQAAAASALREEARQKADKSNGEPRSRAAVRPVQEAEVPTEGKRDRAASPAPAAKPVPARAEKPVRAPTADPGGETGAKPDAAAAPRVLAVDDEQSDRMLLELTLGKLGGFDATVVGSPLQALELLRNQRFDLIVADAMMPELNGMQFVRSARETSGAAGLPIVILSAASPDELGWEMGEKGPTAWLRKPFMPRELVEQLRRLLKQG